MYETNYHRASSVEDAARLMGEAGEGKYLAGGMTLIATMKQRLAAPSDLIDLRHIGAMKGITVNGRDVTIGAGTSHYDVASSDALKAVCRRSAASRAISAILMCATWAQSAAPSPMTTGSGLPVRRSGAEHDGEDEQARDRCGRLLRRHVRNGSRGWRDHRLLLV